MPAMAEQDIVLGVDLGSTSAVMARMGAGGLPQHALGEDTPLEFFGRQYSPLDIAALLLNKLREDASRVLGRPVRQAVLAVPSYFSAEKRVALARAGAQAGLSVPFIVNEPVAATLAHWIPARAGKPRAARRLLVFLLGSRCFEVAALEMMGSRISTLASEGEPELGGRDWDRRLFQHVASEFLAQRGHDPSDDLVLLERCHVAKLSLSSQPRVSIPVAHARAQLSVEVDRERFEALTADLLARCEKLMFKVVARSGGWGHIDEVLLVGGATKMPMISALVARSWGKPPVAGPDPEECVALGAALAASLRQRRPARGTLGGPPRD
jgi:molecular chaperone DnaK